MIERVLPKKEGGNYFTSPKKDFKFIPTGCKMLDLALGGGWPESRISNIIGDRSSGKTLLCIEAAANFAKKYPKGRIRYRECEAAFDPAYAAALGMPVDKVDFSKELETVEDFFEDVQAVAEAAKQPELYILDSLDALSDRSEMGRAIDEGTFGANKAKQLSQTFRRIVRKVKKSNLTVLIVSQVRSKIGIAFGRETTRSGGRALDFYASIVLYLAHVKTLKKERKKIKRAIGIDVLAKVDKNKVSVAFREARFPIMFGWGIDDEQACLDWLKEIGEKVTGALTPVGLHQLVEKRWYEIEVDFLHKPGVKYQF